MFSGIVEMGTEKCPFCGQEIDVEATRCFFCGSQLDEESIEIRLEQIQIQEKVESAQKTRKPVALEVIVVIILICAALFHGSPSRKKYSSGDAGPSDSSTVRLNAKVTFTGTRFVIYNNDSFDWKNVKLEILSESIENCFSLRVPKISAGETYTAGAAEFSKKDGARFNPFTMEPKRFWIRCDTPNKENGSYLAGWK